MTTSQNPQPQASEADAVWLRLRERYQQSLTKHGVPPESIPTLMADVPAKLRGELARRLVQLDCSTRTQLGLSVTVQAYRQAFPELSPRDVESLLGSEVATILSTGQPATDPDAETLPPAGNPGEFSTQANVASNPALEPTVTPSSSSVAGTSSFVGSVIGDYEIVREIARGGMGVVFEARQRKLNRIVALKMILAGQLASDEDVARFYSEAEAAAGLEHPGIVPIYEVGSHAGLHFFSMGYVDGPSLAAKVRDENRNFLHLARIVQQVAEAVHSAHLQGIVHRDLKPANILLTRQGLPKVTDFGLAKSLSGDHERTRSGQILGTPSYMAPEQAAGRAHEAGPAVDIYALGAILFTCLTGRPPFQADSIPVILKQVIEQPPPSPRSLNPQVPRDLETICLKCLEKHPAQRYQSAAEVAAELGRFLSGTPILARRASRLELAARWVRRHPMRVALTVAGVMLVALAAISWQAVAAALASRSLAGEVQKFDRRLATATFTAADDADLQSLISAVQQVDPVRAKDLRDRANAHFARELTQRLSAPRLGTEEIVELEAAIDRLVVHAPVVAAELRERLNHRREQWNTVVDLRAPFTELPMVWPAGLANVDGQTLRLTASSDGFIPTQLVGTDYQQVEIEWLGEIDTIQKLGLSLNHSPTSEYSVLIQPGQSLQPTQPDQSAPQRGNDNGEDLTGIAGGLDFTSQQVKGWELQLRRGPLVLRSQTIHSSQLATGTLRLFVTREGTRLTAQLNDLPPLEFQELFSPRGNPAGVLGIYGQNEFAVRHLRYRQRQVDREANPLEAADQLFSAGDHSAALYAYEQLGTSLTDSQLIAELNYKQAMCLIELKRLDEARERLEQIQGQAASTWSIPAAVWAWVVALRQKDRDAADDCFVRVSAVATFNELAATIPQTVRWEILANYESMEQGAMRTGLLLVPDPKQVRRYSQRSLVAQLLDAESSAGVMLRYNLATRLYEMSEYQLALDILQRMKREALADSFLECRLLETRIILANRQPGTALNLWDEYRQRAGEQALERAPVLLRQLTCWKQLGDQQRVQSVLSRLREAADQATHHWDNRFWNGSRAQSYPFRQFALLDGLDHLDRGDMLAARAAWKRGLAPIEELSEASRSHMYSFTNEVVWLSALRGELTSELISPQARRLLVSENPIVRAMGTILDADGLAACLSRMWQSPQGIAVIRKIVQEEVSEQEQTKLVLALVIREYAWATLMQGSGPPDAEELLWQLTKQVLDRISQSGEMTATHWLQLAASWKGNTGLFGWQGLAPRMQPDLRAWFAYLLARRSLVSNRNADARMYLETVLRDLPADSPVVGLARSDLDGLTQQSGHVWFSSAYPQPLAIQVLRDGGAVDQIQVAPGEQELSLPAGRYQLALLDTVPAGVTLSTSEFELGVARHQRVQARWRWLPGPTQTDLPGLLLQPTELPDQSRWQLVTRWPTDCPTALGKVLFDPAGDRVAWVTAPLARIVHLPDGTLEQVIPTGDVSWSSDGRWLAATDEYRKRVVVWDTHSWQIVREIPVEATWVQFLPGNDTVASGRPWQPFVQVWPLTPGRQHVSRATAEWNLEPGAELKASFRCQQPNRRVLRIGDRELRVLALERDQISVVSQFQCPEPWSHASLSPDHQLLSVGYVRLPDGNHLQLVDAKTGTVLRSISGPKSHLEGADWSKDSRALEIGSFDTFVYRYDLDHPASAGDSSKAAQRLYDHRHSEPYWMHYAVTSVDRSADERRLVSVGPDALRVWDSASQQVTATIGPSLPLTIKASATHRPTGRLATLHADGFVRIWAPTGKLLLQASYGNRPMEWMGWTADGSGVVVIQGWATFAQVLSAETGAVLRELSMSWNGTGEPLFDAVSGAVAQRTTTGLRLRGPDLTTETEIPAATLAVTAFEWGPGPQLYVADSSGRILTCTLDGAIGPVLAQLPQAIDFLSVAPDGQHAVARSGGAAPVLLSLTSTQEPIPLQIDSLSQIAWLSSEPALIGISNLGRLVKWTRDGKLIAEGQGFRFSPKASLSIGEDTIASAVRYSAWIRYWSTKTLQPISVNVVPEVGQVLRVSAAGELLEGDREIANSSLRVQRQTTDGRWELLPLGHPRSPLASEGAAGR